MAARTFRIWRDGRIDRWRWECSLCQPPATGCRGGPDAWKKIVTVSLPSHMRHRRAHHRYVERYGR